MAAPLSKEDRNRIIEFLVTQDLSDLSGRKIAELIEEDTGIRVSQPTASKLRDEAEDLHYEEFAEGISIEERSLSFNKLRDSCREFFSKEGIDILYEMARTGSNREKLEALKLIMQYGYGRPNNKPDILPSLLPFGRGP